MKSKAITKLKGKAGATMVELLVTFALLSMFLAAAAAVMAPATIIFQKVKYQSYARNVSDMVIEKVCGSISSSSGDIVVDKNGGFISFLDDTGSPLYITKDADGYLLMHYRTVWVIEDGIVQDVVIWDAVDWRYDPKAYHGFKITELGFEKTGTDKAVKVSMTIENESISTSYSTSRVVECYNMDPGEDIIVGDVIVSDEDYYQ